MSETVEPAYRLRQCGRHCHPERYRVVSVRQGISRRWGIRDEHLNKVLPLRTETRERAYQRCETLRLMESCERDEAAFNAAG